MINWNGKDYPFTAWEADHNLISAIEQVELLQKFHDNTFHFSTQNIATVKDAILLSSSSTGSLYGKTGTGRIDGKDVNGWFIGYVEMSGTVYYFATNIQDKSDATGTRASEITMNILESLKIVLLESTTLDAVPLSACT